MVLVYIFQIYLIICYDYFTCVYVLVPLYVYSRGLKSVLGHLDLLLCMVVWHHVGAASESECLDRAEKCS